MNQDLLRDKLAEVIANGLTAVSVARVIGISANDLSRFKNGQINLIEYEARKLDKYLSMVNIPTDIK